MVPDFLDKFIYITEDLKKVFFKLHNISEINYSFVILDQIELMLNAMEQNYVIHTKE